MKHCLTKVQNLTKQKLKGLDVKIDCTHSRIYVHLNGVDYNEVLDKKISSKKLSLLKEIECPDLVLDQDIDEQYFYYVGRYTFRNLVECDEHCKKIISMFYRYYTGNIKIIFLTSGYTSYMRGLLTDIRSFDEEIEWDVVGTELQFVNGKASIIKEIDQRKKYEFVNALKKDGKEIVLLADDSIHDLRLFNVVDKKRGISLIVKQDKLSGKTSWEKLCKIISDDNNLERFLKRQSTTRIYKSDYMKNYYELRTNDIGIVVLSRNEYESIKKELVDEVLQYYFTSLSYGKEDVYYLRGYKYYFWLPPYINVSLNDKFEGWKGLYYTCVGAAKYLSDNKFHNSKSINVFRYMVCDHLMAALYLALYYMEEQQLNGNTIIKETYDNVIESIKILNVLLFNAMQEEVCEDKWSELISCLDKISTEEFEIINQGSKYLIELDNYHTVFETIFNILSQLGNRIKEIDTVMCFAYGGIALGHAFTAIVEYLYGKKINIVSSHYSSKRYNDVNLIVEKTAVNKEIVKNASCILLLDNNVTTFKTLKMAKDYFSALGIKTYTAVAEVDYENISKWLRNVDTYEGLCDEWYEVLDCLPTSDYMKAYNTWGTSEKGEILEQIYCNRAQADSLEVSIKNKLYCQQRKICRVHNIYDLQVAMRMGATMIGIHAVIRDKKNYYKNEIISDKCELRYNSLPVPDYEVESIRYMVENMPEGIIPILVIESLLSVEEISQILQLYGLDPKKSGIQIQCFITKEYIDSISKIGFTSIIISAGIMQKNIEKYIIKVDQFLRSKQDYILIDMSKHQPQMIMNKYSYKPTKFEDYKYKKLDSLSTLLKNINIPILLADDINPEEFIMYQLLLKSKGVNLAGLDMQNNIELNKSEQGYCKISVPNSNSFHYAKIRKSVDRIQKWNRYERQLGYT